MRSPQLFLGTLIVVAVSTTYIFVREASLGPRFRISNDSVQNVAVTAAWRDQSRDLGTIEPGATISLTVRDEAKMTFSVRYADGSKMNSKPVYFTSGMTINVSITRESIDVGHDDDT